MRYDYKGGRQKERGRERWATTSTAMIRPEQSLALEDKKKRAKREYVHSKVEPLLLAI